MLLHGSLRSSGHQPNFAALNIGCHLYSAGRPSRWAFAHILVCYIFRLLTTCRVEHNRSVVSACLCVFRIIIFERNSLWRRPIDIWRGGSPWAGLDQGHMSKFKVTRGNSVARVVNATSNEGFFLVIAVFHSNWLKQMKNLFGICRAWSYSYSITRIGLLCRNGGKAANAFF